MGVIILVLAAVVEILFSLYCYSKKSNEKKMRNIIRISALIVFILLTLISIIQWSFRWICLAALLVIWTLIAIVSLIGKKEDKKSFKVSSLIIKSVSMWLILAISVIPTLIFPQYKMLKVTGKFTDIKTATYSLKDDNRTDIYSHTGEKREVNIEFWYPQDYESTSKYPLIVFSHGAFGMKTSNISTFRELASNGYIVCSIDHPYQALFTKDTSGKVKILDKSFMEEVNGVNNNAYSDEDEYNLQQKWLKVRTDDMNFVLDTIIKNSTDTNSDKIYKLIDTSKIGLIGHSLGGAASAALGRERKDIKAVVNLDGDLLGEYTGFNNGKCEVNHDVYPIPLLGIYSDDMKKIFENITDPNIIIPQKLISATSQKSFEVYMPGTNHMSLTDVPLISPFLSNLLGKTTSKIGTQKADEYSTLSKMNSLVLDFFNCYVKDEGDFNPET